MLRRLLLSIVFIHEVLCLLQVFHWSMIPSEMYRVYRRLGGLKYLLLSWVAWILKIFFLNILGPSWLGFHTSFGDGSAIPESYLEHARDVVWRNMVFNRWQQGDIVMIDNFRISHGRQVRRLPLTMYMCISEISLSLLAIFWSSKDSGGMVKTLFKAQQTNFYIVKFAF